MKKSRYNHIRLIQGQTVLFNVMSEKICVMDSILGEIYTANEPDIIQDRHAEFYSYLCENEFLIDESVDEVAKLEKLWEENDNSESNFSVIINPTLNCNMSCWYCYEQHEGNLNMRPELLEAIKRLILSKFSLPTLTSFHLGFFGGEPLLKFDSVCKSLMDFTRSINLEYNKVISFSFVTNGYLLSEEIIKYFKQIGSPISLQITLDGNRHRHDMVRKNRNGNPSYDTILHNCKKLLECPNVHLTLRCNFTSDSIACFTDVITDLKQVLGDEPANINNLTIDFHRVWQDQNRQISNRDDITITEETVKKLFANEGFNLTARKDINRYRCYADRMNHALINFDGNVFRCTARDFTPQRAEGKLTESGEIVWNTLSDERNRIKWANLTCKSCEIYPICSGNCSQSKLEQGTQTGCSHHYSQQQKQDIITRRLNLLIEQAKQ